MSRLWLSPFQGRSSPNLDSMIVDARQDVGKLSLWIGVVKLGGDDEDVDGGGAPHGALIGAKVPFLPTATARSSCSAALFDMHNSPSYECIPAAEAVIDRCCWRAWRAVHAITPPTRRSGVGYAPGARANAPAAQRG